MIYSVRNVDNDGLNYVHHSWHGGHHRSRTFVKAKMFKANCNFERLQKNVNVIDTVCAMSKMMI